MKRIQQKSDQTDSESQTATLTTQTVAGKEIAVVQSSSAAIACIHSGPQTVVLDLEQISVLDRRFVRWFLNMAGDSCRILITGCTEAPVAPILVDGVIEKPLSDEKLQMKLAEFDYRDQYSTLLSEYLQCVYRDKVCTGEDKLQTLRSELTTLQEILDTLDESSAVSPFGRTMREILQRERKY